MQGTESDATSESETDGPDAIENDFQDYAELVNNSAMLSKLSRGWTAYLVAVLPPGST